MRCQRLGRIEAGAFVHRARLRIPLSLQLVIDYGIMASPFRRDIETRLNMNDTDKIVAATFAVARCGGLGHSKPEDYIAEYDSFLRLLNERESDTAERAVKVDPVSPWKFGT